MALTDELLARGLVEQHSAPIKDILSKPRTVYLGADPTADSYHIGHLVPILTLKRLADDGHKIILLIGGGTGMIGDPKEKGERVLLDEKIVAQNAKKLRSQLAHIIGKRITVVDNAEWLRKVTLLEFLRDIGKHFTVNELVKRDLIKRRLETPDESISYTEFTYSLLQGYDYLTLYQTKGVDLQIGGTDQWTNILSGVELIRRKLGKEAFAFTCPLVTDASGKKFGKSEGNAVWLDPKKTSPFQFYQFWRNLPDEGIEKYLKMYSFMPLTDIEALISRHSANPSQREAQEVLARVVTELVHGPAVTAQVVAATDALFGTTPFENLSREARTVALAEAPSVTFSKKQLENGMSLTGILASAGLASSKSEARRLIEGKGISLLGMVIENPDQKIHPGDFSHGYSLIRKGKQHVLILVLK
jgi:tyrosyl-tRNA synthetase